jgi:putative pyruvate formate lyase activating enzyme
MQNSPVYLKTKEEGALDKKIEALSAYLNPCVLCPRQCKVNRAIGELGYCKAPYDLNISSAFPHFGEESPLVGIHGSGTIFLSHCNLKCIFCQNYDISIYGDGRTCSYNNLAGIMIELQGRGCHNINFVTPTHYIPHLVSALSIAIDMGLSVPIVYNCGGYESLEVIKLLEGIVDIYMPDIKFLDPALSKRFCNALNYPEIVVSIIKEMHRQVGDLSVNAKGIATRGLLIRHLVMPSYGENTKKILRFIREEISQDAFVNIMAQYHPCNRAENYPEIARRISGKELSEALNYARELGLTRATNH